MKNRKFLVFLTFLTLAGLLYFFFRPASREPAGAVPSLVLSAPADTRYLIFVDASRLRASSWVSKLIAQSPPPRTDPDYVEFEKATGFDYARDLDQIVFSIKNIGKQPSILAIAEGRFNVSKIEAYAARAGKVSAQDGARILFFPAHSSSGLIAVKFPKVPAGAAQRVLLTEAPVSEEPVSPAAPGASLSSAESPLRQQIERVSGSALFAIAPVEPLLKDFSSNASGWNEVRQFLRDVKWLVLTAQPEADRLRVSIEGECYTLTGALKLSAELSGYRLLMASAMKADVEGKPEHAAERALIDAVLRRGEIVRDAEVVKWRFELGPEIIPALAGPKK